MTIRQLDPVIARVTAVFDSWFPETPIETIRKDWDHLFSDVTPEVGARSKAVDVDGIPGEQICAPDASSEGAILYLHGGGYVLGSVLSHHDVCERISRAAGYNLLAIDYRLAPEHPFPAALDDALSAYRWLLKQGLSPDRIALAGDSAGGGLCLALLLKLKQDGEPLPACAALMSPWVDMAMSGESLISNDAVDPMVHKEMVEVMASSYVASDDRRNPLASPLYGELSGLPPLMIHVGTRETLLDDSKRIAARARDAGVDVQTKIWEGQVHVFQIFASQVDEGEESIRELGAFIHQHLGQ